MADDERELAVEALAAIGQPILYGRVDMARDAGGSPMIMELELTEPSLYFSESPRALARFVAGIRARLTA